MEANRSPSIGSLFSTAVSRLQTVDDFWPALNYLSKGGEPQPPVRSKEAVQEAIDAVNEVAKAVEAAALISRNEELEEIATGTLRYLLVPLLLARAYAQVQGEPRERYAALERAKGIAEEFLYSMGRMGVKGGESGKFGEESRDVKVARFKREKECEKKLQALDEEDEREGVIMVLESGVRKAVELVGVCVKEMEILKFMVGEMERGVDLREKVEREREKAKEKARASGKGAFRIVNEREKLREGVFKPSHSLPTYTVEEWGAIEAERLARAEREKREKVVEVKTEEQEEEEERKEQARWDDWTDEHNKGSGNTMR